MKNRTFGIAIAILSLMARTLWAETFFGPGTITIATNEAILITSVNVYNGFSTDNDFYLDGTNRIKTSGMFDFNFDPRYAIAGPHTLTISTDSDPYDPTWLTFQRFQGSAIKTAVMAGMSTNVIEVPSGKTIQLFAVLGAGSFQLDITIQPAGSTKSYLVHPKTGKYPSFSGPLTLRLVQQNPETEIVSYYFTDEILQMPPTGFLATPAPAMEVNIEKSYNLKDWTSTGAFNTPAESGAFYRLRILK